MPESDILVARQSAVIYHEGQQLGIRRGITTIRAGHPLLATHGHLFEPLVVTLDHTPKQAPAQALESPTTPPVKSPRRSR